MDSFARLVGEVAESGEVLILLRVKVDPEGLARYRAYTGDYDASSLDILRSEAMAAWESEGLIAVPEVAK